jgi:hypothetical protein
MDPVTVTMLKESNGLGPFFGLFTPMGIQAVLAAEGVLRVMPEPVREAEQIVTWRRQTRVTPRKA